MTSEENDERVMRGIIRRAKEEEREACAKFMEMRADVIEREGFGVTPETIARIYRDEANAIRNGKSPVTGASNDD